MIDARKCRQQAEENQYILLRKEVEKKIQIAVSKGRTRLTLAGHLPPELQKELTDAGFRYTYKVIEW